MNLQSIYIFIFLIFQSQLKHKVKDLDLIEDLPVLT